VSWIIIDEIVYPLETPADIREAQAAMREAGLTEADVWVGDPESPEASDTYKNGQRLFAE